MQSFDLERFHATARAAQKVFADATPFPHIVLDDFLHAEVAHALVDEFSLPTLDWEYFYHFNEQKLAVEDRQQMGATARLVIGELQSEPFLDGLGTLTGIDGLLADTDLDGGGLQQTARGGFLNLHTDFLAHTTKRSWSRQINLLLFLNRQWDDAYRGCLELWDARSRQCVRRVAPTFNRCVIFRTSPISFHGIPAGVACPDGDSRKSIALYYFRNEGHHCRLRPTNYVPLPGDPLGKRLLIRLDRDALYVYSVLKRYTPVGNRLATKILKLLGGHRR